MMKIVRYSLLFAIAVLLNACTGHDNNDKDTYVVMLSLDAFRWDYPELTETPNLNAIASNGVRANALIPCYPSKTFPNHYSMATGLYPDHHGIVSNSFYDSTLGYYSIGNKVAVENPAFYGGEPIWKTVEKHGMKAASFFWVGSEAIRPTYWKEYDQSVPFEDKIDTVIHWLSLPLEQRPHLITWYSHEPDLTSHNNGATAPQTLAMARQLDSLVGVLTKRISELPHAKQINIMVVSDHGMADTPADKYINLSDHVSRDLFDMITGSNPVITLKPKPEMREEAYGMLKAIPNLKVWWKSEMPERFVFGKNSRINDIVIEPELGYSIGWNKTAKPGSFATHGYDNAYPEMYGIFFAQGLAFKEGVRCNAFSNTNLYGIIAQILGIEPVHTDGNLDDVKDIFSQEFAPKETVQP